MRAIVSTTIHSPSEALRRFAAMDGWDLIVVGDMRTPHADYAGWDYLCPRDQQQRWPVLSELIGWNCIQRRNLGLVEAYQRGAEVIAVVDDDNIPYEDWGRDVTVGRPATLRRWDTEAPVFDPLSATLHPELWHRGYPLPLLPDRQSVMGPMETVTPDVQADLWNGDPDIDAICRIALNPNATFTTGMFFSRTISPFNSQNTFLSRRVIPHYFPFPRIGRFDDIWAAYHLQRALDVTVAYGFATVRQERNPHDLLTDLEGEMFGYRNTLPFINGEDVLPQRAKDAFAEYQRLLR